MEKLQVWILTFNRPEALNRQIMRWGSAGCDVHVFSNYPEIRITKQANEFLKSSHINTCSYKESNSYCTRSWNNIFIKCFKEGHDRGVFVQDDTDCGPGTPDLIRANMGRYDLMWGPAGDTFFYMHKDILRTVGWFDERYLGCYCGDADFLKRCWQQYDRSRLAIEETHDWGFFYNRIGIMENIRWDLGSKCIDSNYVNQHEELERLAPRNRVLEHSQAHFKAKWQTPGNGINNIGPMIKYVWSPAFPEIDWYPWFTERYLRRDE